MYEFSGRTLSEAVNKAVHGKSVVGFHQQTFQQSLHLKKIAKPSDHFPFQQKIRRGNTLFAGEGNFSFPLGLAKHKLAEGFRLVSTSFESEENLSKTAYQNAQNLVRLGVIVKTDVDATKLDATFRNSRFTRIIFQFPIVVSRSSINGQNPSHTLVTEFLKNVRNHLSNTGEVVITTVDSPFYEGAFKMDEAAGEAGYHPPTVFDFSPDQYSGYSHQNTDSEDSALDNHDAFATFTFSR